MVVNLLFGGFLTKNVKILIKTIHWTAEFMFTLAMRRIVLTLALIAGTIAVKLLTTSDDIKEYQEGTPLMILVGIIYR